MRLKLYKTVVPWKLIQELKAAGVPVSRDLLLLPKDGLEIPLERESDAPDYYDIINQVIEAHDGIDNIAVMQADAENRIKNIPGWATWTPQQAQEWFNTHIDNLAIPADVKTLLFIYGEILLALMDNTWPNRRNNG